MKKIIVTGGSGKAGRAVIADLRAHDYDVLNVDLVPSTQPGRFLRVDLNNMGEVYEVLVGADAVVHLAAIPAPGHKTEEVTFRNNMTSTFNIFQAAMDLGLQRVVWASSETTIGLPFQREQPAYAPIDEDHPLYPESSYALSKILSEEAARQFYRRSGIPFVGLRFSNIKEPEQYQEFPGYWDDATLRRWNLWGYVDARDVAQSCRLGLEADFDGAEHFMIAAGDTVMNRSSKALMAEVYPNVEVREVTGEYGTLLSNEKAKAMLGYDPQHSWRDHVD